MRRLFLVTLLCLATITSAHAELPSLRLDRLQPIGANAGTTVEVEVEGRDPEDANRLIFDHPGIRAEFIKPKLFKVTVGADVPEGTYDVFWVGPFGISNPRQFAITKGVTDVKEKEPNNEVAQAQPVARNSAINGHSDGDFDDCYRISAKKGERLVVWLQAMQLDSPMDGVLEIRQTDGRTLASNGDYFGRDPLVAFTAPSDGEFLIVAHDLSYRGGYPYRLLVTDRPLLENVFPRAATVGKPVELTAIGRQFGGQGRPSKLSLDDSPLEEFTFPWTPAEPPNGLFSFLEHPTAHSVAPTACTGTLKGLQLRAPIGASGTLNACPVLAINGPVSNEAEPNDDRSKAIRLTLPAVVNGRFDQPRDVDWYEFETTEAGFYIVEILCERIAGRADPFVKLMDEKDNLLQEFDDFGHRMNAFDGHLRDPYGEPQLQAKTKYRLLVADRYGRGGPRYQYVLKVRRPDPDVFVAAIHSENPGPAGTTVRQGAAVHYDITIHQWDRMNSPTTLTAEGLPPGVHFAPTTITSNLQGTFVLWADPNAPEFTGPIRIGAEAKHEGKSIRTAVRPYTRVWTDAPSSSRPMRDFQLAVRPTGPFGLRMEPNRLTIVPGQKATAKFVVSRNWPDFKESVRIAVLAPTGHFRFPELVIPANQNEGSYTIEVQAGSPAGAYTFAALGQGQVPYNKDPKAKERPNTLVSTPSQPFTIVIDSPTKK